MTIVLVALDGTAGSSEAMARTLEAARDHVVEIVLVHVHAPEALPPFDDHPPHDLEAWTHEFIARGCPGVSDSARKALDRGAVPVLLVPVPPTPESAGSRDLSGAAAVSSVAGGPSRR